MVSQSFLWACSSSPDVDGPASAAIWADCKVGDDASNLPTSSNLAAFNLLLSISPGVGGASSLGTGGSANAGDSWGVACTCAHILTFHVFLPLLLLGVTLVLAILELKENQPISSQNSFAKVIF